MATSCLWSGVQSTTHLRLLNKPSWISHAHPGPQMRLSTRPLLSSKQLQQTQTVSDLLMQLDPGVEM